MSHSEPARPQPRDPDEEALVAGLSRRDPAASRDFLRRTHEPVYAMTARMTHDPDQRHDWTHEVILQILDELGRGRFVYRWPGCFWSWFQKRSRFLLINLYSRRRKRQERLLAGELGEEIIARLELPGGTDASRLIESVEARAAIEDCLSRLPSEDQKRALTLVLFEELPYQEIADRMETTLNTVRSWIRRARTSVRACVSERHGL